MVQLARSAVRPTTNKPIMPFPRAIHLAHAIHVPIVFVALPRLPTNCSVYQTYQVSVYIFRRCKLAIVIAVRANHLVRRKIVASGATDHTLAQPTRDSQKLWGSQTRGGQVSDVTVRSKFSVYRLRGPCIGSPMFSLVALVACAIVWCLVTTTPLASFLASTLRACSFSTSRIVHTYSYRFILQTRNF